MIAAHHRKYSSGIRELPFFNLFYIGSVDSNGNIVFTFTGSGAGMATNAFSVVDYKSVSHGKMLLVLVYSGILDKDESRLFIRDKTELYETAHYNQS